MLTCPPNGVNTTLDTGHGRKLHGRSTAALDALAKAPYEARHAPADPPRARAGAHAAGKVGLRAGALQPLAGLHRREPALGARPLVGEVLGAILLRLRPRLDRRR